MEIESLLALGFTRNEAIVYEELVHAQSLSAKQLIERTGMHKKIVYDNLERLIEKGVVSSVLLEHAKEFSVESADSLLEYFDKQTADLQARKQKAVQVATEIRALTRTSQLPQRTRMLVGVKAVRQFFLHAIATAGPTLHYTSLGSPRASVTILGEHFWLNLNRRQKETKHRGRLLFNDSLRSWDAQGVHKAVNEVRYLDAAFEPLTQTVTFGDTVGIIVWSSKPVVTVIEDANVATSYREFFNMLWKTAMK